MTSFLIPIIYRYQQHLSMVVNLMIFSPELKWKECSTKTSFKNPGEGGTIAEFSRNCIVPLKFVKDYVDHLPQIEMRKEKRRAESERQQTQRLEQDTNDTEWEQLYNPDQISSLEVHELNLYLVRHGIVENWEEARESVIYKGTYR